VKRLLEVTELRLTIRSLSQWVEHIPLEAARPMFFVRKRISEKESR